MNPADQAHEQLRDEVADLRARLAEASETLHAIRSGQVDAVLVLGPQGDQLFTLKGVDDPYRVLIEEMNEGAVTLSADGSILYCNRRFAELLKKPLQEIVGVAFQVFVAPSERAEFAALLEAGRTGGSAGEITLFAGDASAVSLQLALGPLPAESDAAICLIATDISELRRVEQELKEARIAAALRESAQRYSFLADTVPQIIWTARPDGGLDYYNKAWFDYTGLTLAQTKDWGWDAVVHPADLQPTIERWTHSFTTGEYHEVECRLKRASDGAYRWHFARALPMRDEHGQIVQWVGTCTDIDDAKRSKETLEAANDELGLRVLERTSELHAAKEAAEAASRAKDNFLANLSHELRTPLTPVLMCVADLEQERAIAPEFREQLAMMRHNVELEARLIDDLLDMTRVAHGKLQLLESGPVDIHALLTHTEQILHSEALGKSVHLQFELKACEHHVGGDAARLHQVFWNLFKNAIKFTPEGGRVTVRTANPAPGQIVLKVDDTGMGIDAQTLPIVFQAFEQGEAREPQHSGGLGLGLSISKAIVELHGGMIRAESAGPGLGATFTIEFATVLPFSTTQITEPKPQVESRRLRLLVVEDHEPTLAVLARLLRRHGHDVLTACTVKSALLLASKHSFELVISDIGLPDGNGIDLMRQLTKDHGLRGIALSGYGMAADLAKTEQAGFLAHLVKPINFDQLQHVLQGIAPAAGVNTISKIAG